MTRPKKQKAPITVNSKCVFALCNQYGEMKKKIGSQKYCMIIQNAVFEGNKTITTIDPEEKVVDQALWAEYGYEDVYKVERHTCEGCAFFKDIEKYKLVPSSIPARYAWTVERRAAE